MYISQIEIDNFKSFAEKTVVPLEKGFTTISGPNGSGKSNIIDSVLFCLGLSTSRTMRAEKLSDLVNNLSKRKDCQVTITFTKEPFDWTEIEKSLVNPPVQAAQIPLLAADKEGALAAEPPTPPVSSQVVISRKIKQSAQGVSSTYTLDGKTTTLTEVHETLSRYHISPGSFNVMMQGDVAGFISMSAVERRKIIDELAGVAEFDRKIDQARLELTKTGENIERQTLLLQEIEHRLVQLAEERNQALKYQAFKDEKTNLESQKLAASYLAVLKSIDLAVSGMTDARKAKKALEDTLRAQTDEVQTIHSQLMTLTEAVKRKGEDQQIAIQKQMEGLKGHIARKEDAIGFIEKQQQDNLTANDKMAQDRLRQQQQQASMDADMAGLQQQVAELQALYQQEAQAYQKLEQSFDALTTDNTDVARERQVLRQKVHEAENAMADVQRRLLDIEAEEKRITVEKELRVSGHQGFQSKQRALTERHAQLTKDIAKRAADEAGYGLQIKKCQGDEARLRVSLQQANTSVQQIGRQIAQLEAKKRAYEEMSLSRPVEIIMKSGLDGIHGSLAQLASVADEYSLALEIAIGGRIQNVVVDDDGIGAACIEYLKRHQGGRATFLPLNKIQPSKRLPGLPSGNGIVDYALNIIEFDPRYMDIFAYALGETLIVSSMASARPLLRKYRMVTLEGELLERSGAMTGGASYGGNRRGQKFGASPIGVGDELETLLKQRDSADIEKAIFEKSLTETEIKRQRLQAEHQQAQHELARYQAALEEVLAQQAEIQDSLHGDVNLQDLTDKLALVQDSQRAVIQERDQLAQALNPLKTQLAAIEGQMPSDELAQLRQEMADVKFQMDYYDTQLRNCQTDLQGKTMEKNYIVVGLQEYESRLVKNLEQNQALDREKLAHLEEIELTLKQIDQLALQMQTLDGELKQLQAQRDEVQQALLSLERSKNKTERDIEQTQEKILAFQSRQRELEPDRHRLKQALVLAKVDPDALDPTTLLDIETLQTKIQSLEKKMAALEPVNMLAIQAFDEENARKDAFAEKITTLSTEIESLQGRIQSYQSLKLSAFQTAFEEVDRHFKTVFERLANGESGLVLTNPESPFEGGMNLMAQPRGKKMLRVEAMSGGEKSLTSLAFVFALQRVMPAPFYALDEVDMNLDGINVEKLAHMVKEESEKGAQFVVVSLRKPMIEHSNRTIGVTQKKGGITKLTGIKHREYQPTQSPLPRAPLGRPVSYLDSMPEETVDLGNGSPDFSAMRTPAAS